MSTQERARFTLTIENDTFTDMDSERLSEIMFSLSEIIGGNGHLVKMSENQLVFDEPSVGAWRELQGIATDTNADEDL